MHHEVSKNAVEILVYSIKSSFPIKDPKVTRMEERSYLEGMAVSTTKSGGTGGFWTVIVGQSKALDTATKGRDKLVLPFEGFESFGLLGKNGSFE